MRVKQVTGPLLLPPPVCQNTLAFAVAAAKAEALAVSRRPKKKGKRKK